MPDKLSQFLDDVANAKAKGDAADRSIVADLKGLPPADFARVPREILSGLSNTRYAEIVGSIAPDVTLPAPESASAVAPGRRSLRLAISWIPRAVVAMVTALVAGMVILLIAINAGALIDWWSYSQPLVRTAEVEGWPTCPRLDRWTDGCVYHVTKGISWRAAARDLELPESYLRRLNRHIADDPIPAGAIVVVWRERFPLQEIR